MYCVLTSRKGYYDRNNAGDRYSNENQHDGQYYGASFHGELAAGRHFRHCSKVSRLCGNSGKRYAMSDRWDIGNFVVSCVVKWDFFIFYPVDGYFLIVGSF